MELDYRSRTLWFLLASLLLHFCVMMVLSHDWSTSVPSEKKETVDFEVLPMDKAALDRIRSQIVETSETKKADKAADDAFLGKQTQVVARQTKAATTAPFHEGHKGGASGKAENQAEQKLTLGSLGVKMDYRPMGNLGPGTLATTSDYLKDMQQGAQTLLNTKEYAYYSFFQRVRKQLEQYWEPGLFERLKAMADRGRHLATDQEHSTKLTVIMNKEGTITRIQVDGTSGLMDVDQAAIDAFNKAGPFPNPPHGLVEADGTVRIEWEFVLKT